jgi:hypothetical protein
MPLHLRIAKTAASYGDYATEAKRLARAGRTTDARWYAKHARSDLRELMHLTGQPVPAAHRTADSFAA